MSMKNIVFKEIMDIKDKFDVFIFDVYGVIWSGKEIYQNVLKILQSFKKEGKIIYILSNGTKLSAEWEKNYTKKGLIKGIHYDNAITSGEVARDFLLNKKLKFKNNINPTKFYTVGMKNKKLFENTIYEEVDNPKEADFFYFGIPQLTEEQTKIINPLYNEKIFLSKMKADGSGKKYSITDSKIFKDKLEKVFKLGLPGFNANPDIASLKNDIENKTIKYGLCQGALVEDYKTMGGEVFEIGKPYEMIYDFVFKDLLSKNIVINKDKIVMIGDTVCTDIKGANNVNIKSALCIETGITAYEIFENGKINLEKLDAILKKENTIPDYLIKSLEYQRI